LREETEYRPKPLVEVGGRPILWHIMKIYSHYGFRDFVLCLGYRGNMIKEYFLNYEAMNNDFTIALGHKHQVNFHGAHEEQDFRVTLAETGPETGTGGRVKRIERYVNDDTFMVTYGDGVGNINIGRLLEFHQSHGRLATVTTVRPLSRYGVLDVNGGNEVTHFREKPQVDGWISAGFFVFNRRVFDYLDPDGMLEQQPMERLAADRQLVAYRHEGFWHSMDTYRDFMLLNESWAKEAPWRVWKNGS
jgi:glucose-1-phosphate cytidylyltransferase